jgi:hypothetical protein
VYSFLDTSVRPSVERVRQFWQDRFAQYDEAKKPGLAARFRSCTDHVHLSAFLELFVFAILKRAGYHVGIEPAAGSRALEFLASMTGRCLDFYVECTATGRGTAEVGADAREAEVLDAISEVPTGRFILGMPFIERGAGAPPLKNIRKGLISWLSSLDDREPTGGEWTWEGRGWVIRILAVPAEPKDADEEQGGVGFIMRFRDPDQHLRLRGAIDRKASKYGSLGKPLIVVTASTELPMENDLMRALLGDPLWRINTATHEFSTSIMPNGVFKDSKGPRNVALSAVMHGHCGALSFADKPFVLMHHPFAEHPLSLGLFPFCEERHFDEAGHLVTASPTRSVGAFFGLPSGWPFFDLDPE